MTTAVAHPLVDDAGEGWVATETRADVVALTAGMSDFLHRVASAGDRPIVVSGEFARMTQPLAAALSAVRGAWVVRTAGDGCYDARSGMRLGSPEEALSYRRSGSPDDVHPLFLRSAVTDRLQLMVSVSTRHRVSRPVRLGGVVEGAAERFTGSAPAAWGAIEPLVAPWDRQGLTERSRRRIPLESRWIAVGAGEPRLLATIHSARTREGVEETSRIWVDAGSPGSARSLTLDHDARELLADAARVGMPLIGVAFAGIGAPDLARRCTITPPAEPLALLIGPPGVRALGIDAEAWTSRVGGTTVGSPRVPGVLIPLRTEDAGGWERLSAVLSSLDPSRLAELLALAPEVSAQLRDPERSA